MSSGIEELKELKRKTPREILEFCRSIATIIATFKQSIFMPYNFAPFKKSIIEVETWLQKEFAGIRTGRATPSLLDGVNVEAYGSKMSLPQIASMATEDARTLRVAPWDRSQVKAIEKAITLANLGVSVSVDEQGLRVHFPELTSERRQALVKIAKERSEQARISLRVERDKVWSTIQDEERAGALSEDVKFVAKDELQRMVDAAHETFDAMLKRKHNEIMS